MAKYSYGLATSTDPSISTVPDILTYAAQQHGPRNAMGTRPLLNTHVEKKELTRMVDGKPEKYTKEWTYFELGPYEFITYDELLAQVSQLGSGLRNLGISAGERVQIYARTSANWLKMAHAALAQSIPIVTAYDTLGEEGLTHSLRQTKAVATFTDVELVHTLVKPLQAATDVRIIIYSGGKLSDEHRATFREELPHVQLIDLADVMAKGKASPVAAVPPKAHDLACIMYTSGSTGPPKGVMLKHSNIVAACGGVNGMLEGQVGENDVMICFLPLAHILEFVFENLGFVWGATMGYANVKTLTDASVRNCKGDIAELRPTIMVGVPAVWENVRKGIISRVSTMSGLKQRMFWGAYHAKLNLTSWHLPGSGLLDRIVFDKVKAATGGRLRIVMSGGAPLAEATREFISVVIAPMLVGYGLTETCATGSITSPSQITKGSIGAPVSSVEMKLVDVSDAGYYANPKKNHNSPEQGEIWLRGASVAEGYLDLEAETKEAFEEGWFKTGDIGEWLPNGHFRIIDRKKNLVKTLNGEYIALERLESIYRMNSLVSNLCVYCDQSKAKPVALVVPNEKPLRQMASELQIESKYGDDWQALCEDIKLCRAVTNELNKTGKQAGFHPHELLQGVVLCPEEFTPENGLVTSAQKLQRKKIKDAYQHRIDSAYA